MEENERKKQRLAALEKRERSLAAGIKYGSATGSHVRFGSPKAEQSSPRMISKTVGMQPVPVASTVRAGERIEASTVSHHQPPGGESVYSRLPDSFFSSQGGVTTNASGPPLDASGFVDDFVRALLGSNSKVHDAGAALDNRLSNKTILLDNPGGGAGGGRAERAKRKQLLEQSRRLPKHLRNRQHKARGSFKILPSLQRYAIYAPLHELWKTYIKGLLSESSPANMSNRLLSADFHGAVITVVRAKDPSTVGWRGIVVQETAMTFSIITELDCLKLVLKKGTVFTVEVEDLTVTLYGNALVDARGASAVPSSNKCTTIEL